MMNNVSFQGHTNLMFSPNKFREIAEITERRSRNLRPDNKCIIRNGQIYTAQTYADNILVFLRNEEGGILKFIPTNAEMKNKLAELNKALDDMLATSKAKLTAWIIGGSKIDSKNGENTIITLNKVANVLCDRQDIDTSILVGTKDFKDKNLIFHSLKDNLELTIEAPKGSKPEDIFEIVETNKTNIN